VGEAGVTISTADLISALFELVTIFLISVDVVAIHKDKQLRGSRIWPKFYWLGYGCWGCYLFHRYHLPLSFWVCVASEVLYLGYIFQCLYHERKLRLQAWGAIGRRLAESHIRGRL
jgi:hypothetical protein